MDNNDQDKTVVVERETQERSSSPLGTIIAVVVLIILAILAYNLLSGGNSAEAPTGTGTDTTAPTESTTPTPAE